MFYSSHDTVYYRISSFHDNCDRENFISRHQEFIINSGYYELYKHSIITEQKKSCEQIT